MLEIQHKIILTKDGPQLIVVERDIVREFEELYLIKIVNVGLFNFLYEQYKRELSYIKRVGYDYFLPKQDRLEIYRKIRYNYLKKCKR